MKPLGFFETLVTLSLLGLQNPEYDGTRFLRNVGNCLLGLQNPEDEGTRFLHNIGDEYPIDMT
jgi:hypothetical protein